MNPAQAIKNTRCPASKCLCLISVFSFFFFCFYFTSNSWSQKTDVDFVSPQQYRFFLVINGQRQNDIPFDHVKVNGMQQGINKVKVLFEKEHYEAFEENVTISGHGKQTFLITKKENGEFALHISPPQPAPAFVKATADWSDTTDIKTKKANSLTGDVQKENKKKQGKYIMPGYYGSIGCSRPISAQEFSDIKNTIAAMSFEESKLNIAKQIASSNCLLARQVKEIIFLFNFEDTRLDFAKYAFSYTYDVGNYFIVNESFKFEISVDELNRYIRKK